MSGGISQVNNNPSYGALKDDLGQTAQNLNPKEAAEQAQQTVKDSWIGSVAEGVAPSNMSAKKLIFSLVGTALMVFGISYLGKNTKMFKHIGTFGDNISNLLKLDKAGNSRVGKFFKNIGSKLTKPGTLGGKISTNIKEIFAKNTDGVRSNLLRGKSSFTKTMAPGTKFEVVDNVADPLRAMYRTEVKGDGFISKLFKPIREKMMVLTEGSVDKKITNQLEFEKLLENKTGGGGKADYQEILKLLQQESVSPEEEFKLFGLLKKYFANDIKNGGELFTSKAHGFKVNFIDSLRRAEMINAGEGGLYNAKTALGRILQKGIFRTMEAPSNGVASRGIMPFMIALPIQWGIMGKVFDAKKEDKGKKFAEETVRDAGSYMLIPTAMGAMYGGASLFKYFGLNSSQIQQYKNLLKNADFTGAKAIMKNGAWWEKALRLPGKILGMGLEGKPGTLKGAGGGALRFALYMFVLSPLLIKPVMKLCHTIFGKPSDTKAEEAKIKQEKLDKKEAKANQKLFLQTLRSLGMSEQDLALQLQQRPDIIQRLQTEEGLAQKLEKNPMILFDLLNTPPAPVQTTPTIPSNMPLSPSLRDKLANQPNTIPAQYPTTEATTQANPVEGNNTNTANPAVTTPPRSYIPSSTPAKGGFLSPEQQDKLNGLYAKADRAEAEAMKWL